MSLFLHLLRIEGLRVFRFLRTQKFARLVGPHCAVFENGQTFLDTFLESAALQNVLQQCVESDRRVGNFFRFVEKMGNVFVVHKCDAFDFAVAQSSHSVQEHLEEHIDGRPFTETVILRVFLGDPLEECFDVHRFLRVSAEHFVQQTLQIFVEDESEEKSVEKSFRIHQSLHHPLVVALDESDCIGDDVFGEIGTQQSYKLKVIQTVAHICVRFEDSAETVQKTTPIDRRFAERGIRFQNHMFSFAALTKVLSHRRRSCAVGLC